MGIINSYPNVPQCKKEYLNPKMDQALYPDYKRGSISCSCATSNNRHPNLKIHPEKLRDRKNKPNRIPHDKKPLFGPST
jgi:hypothetical protein